MPAILANAKNFLSSSDYPVDMISGSYPSSVTVAGLSNSFPEITHNLGYAPLYYVKWSLTSDFSTSYDETGVGVSSSLQASFTAQTSTTKLYLFINNNSASSRTFYYRVIYFMPPDTNITVAPTQANFDSFVLSTDFNSPKIYLQDRTLTGAATITHSLGYYPQVEVWKVRASDGRIIHHLENDSDAVPLVETAKVTTTQLILADPSAYVGSWYYKIYVDEV